MSPAAPEQEPEYDDVLPEATHVPKGGFRDRMRHKPGIGHAYRLGVFIAGLLFILAGFALVVLPGPLTIPPIIIGLWIWSTEFEFAHRLLEKAREKGREALEHAKRRPVSSSVVTAGGLIGAALAIWAVTKYDLIEKGKDAVGL
jgi:putative transmembrane protein PGPGW